MIPHVLISIAILGAVLATSWRFNRYVDGRPMTARADGETALWVIFGCTYVVLAASVLVGVWAPWLPSDWRLGLVVGGINFAAFVAGGIPMALGDHQRSATDRRTNEALERAVSHLGVGQRAPVSRL